MSRTVQDARALQRLALVRMTLQLDLPILLSEPRRLTPYSAWHQHIPFAMWLTALARPHVLVELGTHYGDSYCAFCQAVETLGLDTRCFAVDTWAGDEHVGEVTDVVLEDLRAHHDPLYGAFSTLLQTSFDDAVASFDDGSIDLLHIDGYHTYEAVSHDFHTWLPKMSSHGIILMHDILERGRNFGVWRVWDEIKRAFVTFEFTHGFGLGVAAVGSELPEGIAQLFQASPAEQAYFRRLVQVLGGRLSTRMQRDGIISGLQEDVRRLSRELEGSHAELATALSDLAEERSRADQERTNLEEKFEQERRSGLRRQQLEIEKLEERSQHELAAIESELANERRETEGLREMLDSERAALARIRDSRMFRYTYRPRLLYASYLQGKRQAQGQPSQAVARAVADMRPMARRVWAKLPSGTRKYLRPAIDHVRERLEEPTPLPDLRRCAPYESWQEVNELNDKRLALLRSALNVVSQPPLLSVVMPVFDPPLQFLEKAIQSVFGQVYENWELCIADDASTNPAIGAALERWANTDSRVHVTTQPSNSHISRATNSAAELASGDWLVFLDHDDLLSSDALAELALYISEHPEVGMVYSDHDRIDAEGTREAPQFKPAWSPELLLSYMYMGHVLMIRRSLFEELGGARSGFEGSQDYDLALRGAERCESVGHIPKVLYHWRALPGSTASSGGEKRYSFEAGRRAVTEALSRRGIDGEVSRPDWAKRGNLGLYRIKFPDAGPRVAVLVPTRDHLDLLRACVESVKSKTSYQNYELVIVDNESSEPSTLRYLEECGQRVLRIPSDGKFNFARLNNLAAGQVEAEYLLFLNNDTVVLNSDWLSQMMGYAQLHGVGAVGARLLFRDGHVQHAGVVAGLHHGLAGHAFKGLPAADPGYLGYSFVSRNCAAVTAACMVTPRKTFFAYGGFDEENFAVAYNDADYCYRLREHGLRIVYCAEAELTHHEGSTRGFRDNPGEVANFKRLWSAKKDPYYNPNLSLADESYQTSSRALPMRITPRIRMVMCSFNLKLEGAPFCQYELTVQLAQKGLIDPVVYSPTDGPLRSLYESHGIEVEVFRPPTWGVGGLHDYEVSRDKFADWLVSKGAEVLYGNTMQTFYAIDAAARAGLPSVWNPRESDDWRTYFSFLPTDVGTRALSCFQWPYQVVFVADATLRAWSPFNVRHNFMTIHDGLDRLSFGEKLVDREVARASLGIAAGEVVVLAVGTVCERKGQLDLVGALREMPIDIGERIRIIIVGDRRVDFDGATHRPMEYSERVHEAVAELPVGLRNRISIVAETPDVGKYYSAADVFVCSSRAESYPRVLLEAMAAGLPVITTPVFGIVEQVVEGVNALFYTPGDASALARHIAVLARDEPMRAEMGSKSILVLDGLQSFEGMAEEYGRVFEEAWLSGRPRGSTGDIR